MYLYINRGVKKGDTLTIGGEVLTFKKNHWRWQDALNTAQKS